jgi:integrase/recombinase XerD
VLPSDVVLPGSDGLALFINKSGVRITTKSIQNMTTKHAERVGLHDPKSSKLEDKFTPHCCRHWFITHLIRSGMPRDFVQELRGDVRREAIDIYNHIDRQELRKSYLTHIPSLGV